MTQSVRIGIVGDYNPDFESHRATTTAIDLAARAMEITAQADWLPTPEVPPHDPAARLAAYDAIWLAPGSPYASFAGALAAVRFAREQGWPFTAT
jgi:CTP synthase (UTP-ammonia lyase)